jgi:hypothetical protein
MGHSPEIVTDFYCPASFHAVAHRHNQIRRSSQKHITNFASVAQSLEGPKKSKISVNSNLSYLRNCLRSRIRGPVFVVVEITYKKVSRYCAFKICIGTV